MSKSKYTLSIPKPCHETWAEMSISEQGRFCANCQKHVIDFSTMSETEIIRKIKNSSGGVCGRLRETSIDKEIIVEELSLFRYFQKIAAGILLLNFFTARSEANKPAKEGLTSLYVHTWNSKLEQGTKVPVDSTITMNFMVIDSKTKKPVPFTHLSIHSDSSLVKQGTTDRNGKIQLHIPNKLLKSSLKVEIINFPLGYISQSLQIVPEKEIYSRKILLVPEELNRNEIMGDIQLKE